jgi:hypothetical protein
MVRNECIRSGGHVKEYVSYKILRLETPKIDPNFAQFALLAKVGLRQLWIQCKLRCLGVNITYKI